MGRFMNAVNRFSSASFNITEPESEYYFDSSFDSSFDRNSNSTSASSFNMSFAANDYNDELADKITTLAGQINAAEYRFLKIIAEFDRRVAWEGPGIRSCAYWLNWKCGIAMGAAREKVRAAKTLDGLPEINAAFEKGELSYSKVRAMTRVATEQNESFLLDIAQCGTAQHMEKLVGAFRTVSRVEDYAGADTARIMGELDESIVVSEPELDQRRAQLLYESREVSCYQDDEGMWIIKAKLPAEEGGLLAKVITALSEEKAADEKMREEKISAETFSGYKKDDSYLDKIDLEKGDSEKLTFPQCRADALAAMAEHFLATAGEKKKVAERCQLVLHVHHGSSLNTETNRGASLDGRWLLPDAARRLACDAGLLLVSEDEAGNVLDIGRKTRIIPVAMARALSIRDGGCCQFPGCCNTRYVEGHHIQHWADGGETKLDNLVTLCKHHHRELHKGKYFLSVKPLSTNSKPERFADRLCFSTMEQSQGLNKNHHRMLPNPVEFTCACCGFDELEKNLLKSGLKIDANTAVTKWQGEQMDLGMAVDGLINLPHAYRQS
jgi:hypothetical protein